MLCVTFLMAVLGCTADKNIVQVATDLGATTLVQYVRTAGLEGTLAGKGDFTVFAPTNAAFDALPQSVKNKLMNDKDLLKKVLMFHVTDTCAYSSDLRNDMLVTSLDAPLKIRVNIYQNGGSQVVTVDGAKVTLADQNATNGVIHVIDRVMYPFPEETIPKAVATIPELGTLLYAVAQGQLVYALGGDGPFTLFAPTNDAFNKLPAGALSDLLSNQTALVAVLKYHVVPATAYSAGLTSGSVQTLEGRSVNVVVSSDGVMVNNAKVVMADIPTSNGVIHEIDQVLLPPN